MRWRVTSISCHRLTRCLRVSRCRSPLTIGRRPRVPTLPHRLIRRNRISRWHAPWGISVPPADDPTSSGINCQYPLPNGVCDCGTEDGHSEGQLLSGPWVRIRTGLKASSYGETVGLERARQLFGRWTLVTMGGDGTCHSAHPGTLVEAMSVANGSVELSIVCSSFASHNIHCGDLN